MPAASRASSVSSMDLRYIPEASLRIRKEQLLAADLVVGDRFLSGGRDDPVDECLAELRLHARMLRGIDQHDSILVEEASVALHRDGELAAVLEGKPGCAV